MPVMAVTIAALVAVMLRRKRCSRSILPMTGAALMGTPEIYFQSRPGAIDDDGTFTDERIRTNMGIWVERFSEWIARFAAPRIAAAVEERRTA